MEVTDQDIEVHALSAQSAENLRGGEMDRRVTQMEGET